MRDCEAFNDRLSEGPRPDDFSRTSIPMPIVDGDEGSTMTPMSRDRCISEGSSATDMVSSMPYNAPTCLEKDVDGCSGVGDEAAERRLRRKIDLHILPICWLAYACCFIDRINLGNAKIAGLEEGLKMNTKGYDYNFLVMAFYLPYAITEFPLLVCCKRVGPGWW